MTRKEQLEEFQKRINYHFKNQELLNTALTHSSYANESKEKVEYNERLEFLGDSVLSLILSDYLFRNFPDYPEGTLTKIRASVVSELSLAEAARKLGLGQYLLLGKGEISSGGRDRNSLLADAVESVIAAIYMDDGFESAKRFTLQVLGDVIPQVVEGKLFRDYKTDLQEYLQRDSNKSIEYQIVREEGPDHDKVFVVQVLHGDEIIGMGQGHSKKEAEQAAAQKALKQLYE